MQSFPPKLIITLIINFKQYEVIARTPTKPHFIYNKIPVFDNSQQEQKYLRFGQSAVIFIMNSKLFKIALLTILIQIVATQNRILNPYKELGVSTTASRQQVKKAFKQLSLQYHPDRNPNDPLHTQRYQKIIQAYEMIKQEWAQPIIEQSSNQQPTFIKIEDILDQMNWQGPKTHFGQTEKRGGKSFILWCFDNPEIVMAAFCLSIGLVIACR